jgi:DNA-directed RNA polymerase subunit M/transcription elongation factor TFIIS
MNMKNQHSLITTAPKYPNAMLLNFGTFYTDAYVGHRRLKIIALSNILGQFNEFKTMQYNEQVIIVKEIEQGCYVAACEKITELDQEPNWENSMFYSVYNYICGNLFQNLDPGSELESTYLITKVFSNEVDLYKLATMSSEELCPEKSLEIRTKIIERSEIKFSTKVSTTYRCNKCKKNECTLDKRHTRGLDEATNYRATCIFCKHTWNI